MKHKKQPSGRPATNPKANVSTEEAPRPAAKPLVLRETQVRALLILILAIATFLRVYRIDTIPPGFYADEAMDGNDASQALETGHFQVFYPENHGREGMFINLAAACIAVFGHTTWAVRLPTVMIGVLNVWVIYLLTAKFFSPPAGLLAAFFAATSLWQVIASRFSNRANAVSFFLALTLYLLVISAQRLRESKARTGTVLLAGVVYGLGFHTYTAHRATPLLIGSVWLYWYFQARREGWISGLWKSCLLFAAATAVVVSPLAIYLLQHPSMVTERAAMVSVFNAPNPAVEVVVNAWKMAQMFFFSGDTNWRQNIAGQRELFWPVAILFAAGIGVAMTAIRRRAESFPYALALGWIAVGVLPTIFTTDGVPHALRSLIIIPAVFMLTAVGALRVYGYLAQYVPRTLRMAAVGFFLLICCCEPYYMYFYVWAVDPNVPQHFDAALAAFAARVNAVPREVPKYIAIARNTNLVNGLPIEVQTAVFLTRSYTKKEQAETNIHYVLPPSGAKVDARAFCSQVVEQNPGSRVFCLQ